MVYALILSRRLKDRSLPFTTHIDKFMLKPFRFYVPIFTQIHQQILFFHILNFLRIRTTLQSLGILTLSLFLYRFCRICLLR